MITFGPGAQTDGLSPKYANRHGLITGSTGSGKTRTMLRLAAEFRRLRVPVFVPDVKGDVAVQVMEGVGTSNRPEWARLLTPGSNFKLSVLRMGADLTARAFGLTDAQQGIVESALAMGVAVHRPSDVGNMSAGTHASRQALFRQLNRVDRRFFGPDSFDVAELLPDARLSVLDCRALVEAESMYAATVVHLLADLMARLPEVGDRAAPTLVFFIDEAHLLFRECPPRLLNKIESIVRLIRSKGVSLWFVTQSPGDIPDSILAQLGNRVQHSLRATTPAERRALEAAAMALPKMWSTDGDVPVRTTLIEALPPGRALISMIGANGQPRPTTVVSVSAPDWRSAPPTTESEVKLPHRFTDPTRCEAVQYSDLTRCERCDLEWDTNDDDAPPCPKIRAYDRKRLGFSEKPQIDFTARYTVPPESSDPFEGKPPRKPWTTTLKQALAVAVFLAPVAYFIAVVGIAMLAVVGFAVFGAAMSQKPRRRH